MLFVLPSAVEGSSGGVGLFASDLAPCFVLTDRKGAAAIVLDYDVTLDGDFLATAEPAYAISLGYASKLLEPTLRNRHLGKEICRGRRSNADVCGDAPPTVDESSCAVQAQARNADVPEGRSR